MMPKCSMKTDDIVENKIDDRSIIRNLNSNEINSSNYIYNNANRRRKNSTLNLNLQIHASSSFVNTGSDSLDIQNKTPLQTSHQNKKKERRRLGDRVSIKCTPNEDLRQTEEAIFMKTLELGVPNCVRKLLASHQLSLTEFRPLQAPFVPFIIKYLVNSIERDCIRQSWNAIFTPLNNSNAKLVELHVCLLLQNSNFHDHIKRQVNSLTLPLKFDVLRALLAGFKQKPLHFNKSLLKDLVRRPLYDIHQRPNPDIKNLIRQACLPSSRTTIDTLAFIMFHLHHAWNRALSNVASKTKLANIYGPLLVSFSERPVIMDQDPNNYQTEEAAVLEVVLEVCDIRFWDNLSMLKIHLAFKNDDEESEDFENDDDKSRRYKESMKYVNEAWFSCLFGPKEPFKPKETHKERQDFENPWGSSLFSDCRFSPKCQEPTEERCNDEKKTQYNDPSSTPYRKLRISRRSSLHPNFTKTMDVTQTILDALAKKSPLNSLEFAESLNLDHQIIVGGIKSLQQIDGMINTEQIEQNDFVLTDEGQYVQEHGSHEFVIYNSVPDDGISMPDLMKTSKYAKVGVSKALAAKWISVTKNEANIQIVKKLNKPSGDEVQACLEKLKELSVNERNDLKKRKLITEKKTKVYIVEKGPNFTTHRVKEETDLTSEMVQSGSWKDLKFKKYNFKALGVLPEGGHLHPLLRVRAEFRRILMDMGFSEMPTNNFVESSFWNFDSLFQPQQHPARDAHDTFFLSDPATTDLMAHVPHDYLERVKKTHEVGGYGSRGYRYDWQLSEAAKNLLRTHTTAVSARMLYQLAQQKEFTPQRYFSIDRVFRNETLDATHLAEFHQVEGVFADYGLNLGHLKAVIRAFFAHLGLRQLRFKPAYNPYTEPSMEIFSFHPGLKKWVEIGNSGIFRPEMLRPMGLPEGVRVIAWGLSLERPTMIRYGYKNIRDLMGPKVDLRMVYDSPLCRLDKF